MRFWLPFARSLCSLVRRLRQIGRRRAEARGEGQIRQTYGDRSVIVATAVHGGLTTISRSTTHCPTRVGSVRWKANSTSLLWSWPISYSACLATRRRVPILSKWGRRVEFAIVQEDTTSRCHRFFSQTQRRHFFPPPNSTNRDPTVPLMPLCQIHHHGLCRPVLHTYDDADV